jgi:hypothetical protein
MQKKIHAFFLSIAVTLYLSSSLLAQTDPDIRYTFHDDIYAPSLTKKWNDFNLKGKVKSVETVILLANSDKEWHFIHPYDDTTRYEFTAAGLLLRSYAPSPKMLFDHMKATTQYSYNNNQLYKVLTESPVSSFRKEELFGNTGYLEKSTVSYLDNKTPFYREAFYAYSDSGRHLDIRYDYKDPSNNWDLELSSSCDFTFDERKRVTTIRQKFKHTNGIYGSFASIAYDAVTGKPTKGSLEFLLDMEIRYDDRGNITYKKKRDSRRSEFKRSAIDIFFARYNERNDIMEEYRKIITNRFGDKEIDPVFKNEPGTVPNDFHQLKKVYTYEYDSNNNWIKKYEITVSGKTLISSRTINYFTE